MRGVTIAAGATVGNAELPSAMDALPETIRGRAVRAERVTQLTLAAAGAAWGQAGCDGVEGPVRPGAGVVLGTAFGCFLTNAAFQRRLAAAGVPAASPRLFAATVSNAAAGELGIAYRLGGPAITLTAGGAAGLLAVGHAADLVAGARAELMVAGGVDASGPALEDWLAAGGLELGGVRVRERAAILVLARSTSRPPLGGVLGHAAGYLPPGAAGTTGLLRRALDDAGVRAGDLELVALAGDGGEPDVLLRAVRDAAGGAELVTPATRETGFAADGPYALLAALASAKRRGLVAVVQRCPSGHAAALIAAREGA